MKYMTSDLHFGHANIIKFCKRPFTSVEEMDEAIITNWNNTVTSQDLVYLLGDVSFYRDPKETIKLIKRLKGNIILIKGNHDERDLTSLLLSTRAVSGVKDFREFSEKVNDQLYKFTLCHYPLQEWRGSHHGSIHLHGHCHGTMDNDGLLRLDVGVDSHNFTPISLEQVVSLIEAKKERILSGAEVSVNSFGARCKEFNQLYLDAEIDYAEFMKNYLKYKEFYDVSHIS